MHVIEITSSHAALEEQPEVPPSDAVATATATGAGTATTAPPVTATAQEELATPAATPSSLLDDVSSFVFVNFIGSSPRGCVQLV